MNLEKPQQQQTEQSNQLFEWPASAPPHSQNLVLASKLCATTCPTSLKIGKVTTTHLPSGWSSNDVIEVSFPVSPVRSKPAPYPHNFIVKLPRVQSSPLSTGSSHSSCKPEALRTSWAARHGFGPKVLAIDDVNGAFAMEYIDGGTLRTEMALKHLKCVVGLLKRIHSAKAEDWMRRYDPLEVVKSFLEHLKKKEERRSIEDVRLIEAVVRKCEREIGGGSRRALVPCHNDFHTHNVMLRHDAAGSSSSSSGGRLLAIDFENCDLGDPMWDLAYLTVNLELEGTPLALADLYGADRDERRRLRAYVPLAMAHCATWAGVQAGLWVRHQSEVMGRLREVVGSAAPLTLHL